MTFFLGVRVFLKKNKKHVSPEAHGLYISTFVFQTGPSMKGPGPIQGPGWALGPLFGPEPFIWPFIWALIWVFIYRVPAMSPFLWLQNRHCHVAV